MTYRRRRLQRLRPLLHRLPRPMCPREFQMLQTRHRQHFVLHRLLPHHHSHLLRALPW